MGSAGYVGTSVADIIGRAGVSCETFYRLYDDKLDCFLATFDLVAAYLVERVEQAPLQGSPMERVESVVTTYLQVLAHEPAAARLFLVEVHAAGPAAIVRRAGGPGASGRLRGRHARTRRRRTWSCGGPHGRRGGGVARGPCAGRGGPRRSAGDRPMVLDHVAELERAGVFGPDEDSDRARVEPVTGRSFAHSGTVIGRSPGRGSTSGQRVPE